MLKLKDGYDAVVPRIEENKIEPLHAIYSKDSLDIMKEQLDLGHLKVHESLLRLNVRYIDRNELMQFGPQLLSFFNINSKQDLARASCIIKGNNQYLQHT
jgi:molybdopterin-guanine dinucleotide biosynthesis protein A